MNTAPCRVLRAEKQFCEARAPCQGCPAGYAANRVSYDICHKSVSLAIAARRDLLGPVTPLTDSTHHAQGQIAQLNYGKRNTALQSSTCPKPAHLTVQASQQFVERGKLSLLAVCLITTERLQNAQHTIQAN